MYFFFFFTKCNFFFYTEETAPEVEYAQQEESKSVLAWLQEYHISLVAVLRGGALAVAVPQSKNSVDNKVHFFS